MYNYSSLYSCSPKLSCVLIYMNLLAYKQTTLSADSLSHSRRSTYKTHEAAKSTAVPTANSAAEL